METVTLRTARLVLSAPTSNDAAAIYRACQDADIQRYTTVPSPYLLDDALAYVGRVAEDWASGDGLVWGIRVGGELAGAIGLHRITGGGDAELGYWMGPGFRGRGYLVEAGRAVLDYGFSSLTPPLQRIEWRAVADNVASARAGRALGFRYEGTLRQALTNSQGRSDAWVAGLLATDDRAPRPWPPLTD
jgi:RimJ/RimL family protein N-acetyltransferase